MFRPRSLSMNGNSGAMIQRSRPTSPKPNPSSVTAFHSYEVSHPFDSLRSFRAGPVVGALMLSMVCQKRKDWSYRNAAAMNRILPPPTVKIRAFHVPFLQDTAGGCSIPLLPVAAVDAGRDAGVADHPMREVALRREA